MAIQHLLDIMARLRDPQRGCPTVLPNGAQVSQNNVAKEAGKDPTALKKARFPELIREIQEWVENGTNTATSRKPNRDTRAKIANSRTRLRRFLRSAIGWRVSYCRQNTKSSSNGRRFSGSMRGEPSTVVDFKRQANK